MSRISIGTWTFLVGTYADRPADLDAVLRGAAGAGYDGVALAGFKPHASIEMYPTRGSRQELMRRTEDLGLAVNSYAADLLDCHFYTGTRDVLERYGARFDRSLVAFVLVAPQPDSDESKLGGALAAVPDVQEVHYVAGEDGFMIKIRAADTVRLERIRREKIAALPQVRSTRTMIVLQTYKETARIPLDDSSIQKIRKRRT